MKIKALVVALTIAILGLFPLAGPASATHSCGFEPCPHPDDVITLLCWKFPVIGKYLPICD